MNTPVVDPETIPVSTLSNGAVMPMIGLGTFGSDKYGPADVAAAVLDAAELGYRHFDCAAVYANEREVGESLRTLMRGGLARESLWITSKVWNDRHDDVIGACDQSLRDLGLDYLDLYLVHWPFPNFHPPGCPPGYHNPNAQPYRHEAFMRTWSQMETLVRSGRVRAIGTSNMTIPKMTLLLRDCTLRPVANEMELHPHFQQPELFDFMQSRQIQPIGFCPIGSPSRPQRDRTESDTCDMDDPVIRRIAERQGIHPAAVCLQWAVKRGTVTIPFSVKPDQLRANLQAIAENPLTPEDLRAIADIDQNCRLIKGQVFLWREGQHWQDLWDPDGTIPV